MNELQLSLLGLGAVALVLVIVYNRWLERKYRKKHALAPAVESETTAPAGLHDSGRQEPQWNAGEAFSAPADDEPKMSGSMAESIAFDASTLDPLSALSEAENWVDAIATLRFYEPRTAGSIRDTLEQMGTVRFERVEFYTGNAWYATDKLGADVLVSNIRCRLQLASRRGAVPATALHEWFSAVESLAQVLSAGLAVESEAAILQRATSLDEFCARVDALISLHLRAREGMPPVVPAIAEKASTLNLAGSFPHFARLNAWGDVEFQISADEAQGLLSLTLDYPQVLRPDLVVADMLTFARNLAVELSAEIVDDAGHPLDETGMALLSNQVVRLSAMLQAQGIEPGSPLSRRLFA